MSWENKAFSFNPSAANGHYSSHRVMSSNLPKATLVAIVNLLLICPLYLWKILAICQKLKQEKKKLSRIFFVWIFTISLLLDWNLLFYWDLSIEGFLSTIFLTHFKNVYFVWYQRLQCLEIFLLLFYRSWKSSQEK